MDYHDSRYESSFFVNKRGLKIFTQEWLSPLNVENEIVDGDGKDNDAQHQSCKGLIFIVHGAGHHGPTMCDPSHEDGAPCDPWKELVELFLSYGYHVFSLDNMGCGRSEGDRFYIDDFNDYADDAEYYLVKTNARFPNSKVFLYGESMGGAIAILLSLRNPEIYTGLILVVPMCKIAEDVIPPSWTIPILQLLVSWFPKLALIPEGSRDLVYKDEEVRKWTEKDPLNVNGNVKLKTADQLLKATQYLTSNLESVSVPFIVLHGDEDILTSTESSRQLFQCACATDKTLRIYKKMWHGVRADPDRTPRVLKDLIGWVTDRS